MGSGHLIKPEDSRVVGVYRHRLEKNITVDPTINSI
jgi:hypothetical protein